MKYDGINPITKRPYIFLEEEAKESFNLDLSRWGSIEERVSKLENTISRSIRDEKFDILNERYGINKELAYKVKCDENYKDILLWCEGTRDLWIYIKDDIEFLACIRMTRDF